MVVLPEWIHEVAATLPSPFTGKLEINYVDDGVAVMNVMLSFKPSRKISLDKQNNKIIVAIRQAV